MTSGPADVTRFLTELDRHPPAARLLAAHAALAAAVNADLLRHLRDNFLLDGPEPDRLPVTADSEAVLARLLLSPLFTQVDDELFEMQPAGRAWLLRELHRYDGGARIADVAALLERYTLERSDWPEALRWAQRVSARVVAADPEQVGQWLDAGAAEGGAGLDRRWFSAMRTRLEQDREVAAALPSSRPQPTRPDGEGAAETTVLDRFPYPWSDPAAQQLHIELTRAFPASAGALRLAETAGIERYRINAKQAPARVWKDILEDAAVAGLTRRLVEVTRDQLAPDAPLRALLDGLLADRSVPTSGEPLVAAGAPDFVRGDEPTTVVAEIGSHGSSARAFRVLSSGLWVTPAHVAGTVGGRWEVRPLGRTSRPVTGDVVLVDTARDVAVLRTGPAGWPDPSLPLGSSTGLAPGATLHSLGVPPGAPALVQFVGAGTGQWGLAIGDDLGRGSSGCPLQDDAGRVVGMFAAARVSPDGPPAGYAVPVESILAALAERLDPYELPLGELYAADARLLLRLAEVALAARQQRSAATFVDAAFVVARHVGAADAQGLHAWVLQLAPSLAEWLPPGAEREIALWDPAEAHDETDVGSAAGAGRTIPAVPADLREAARGLDRALDITDSAMRAQALDRRMTAARAAVARRRGDPAVRAARPVLLASASVGQRLVGILVLQDEPDAAFLTVLATRTDRNTDPYQVCREALVALGDAATRLPPEHLDAIEQALQTATTQHDRRPDIYTERLLQRAREAVAERRLAQRAGPPADRTPTAWTLWTDRSVLRVRFLGGTREQQTTIREVALDWVRGTRLTLVFLPVGSTEPAEIRIAVTTGELSWSYLGSSALAVPADQPTMGLDVPLPLTGWHRQQALREFGHALGLVAEHQQPNAELPWDRDAVLRSLTGPPNRWARETVEAFLCRYEFPAPPAYRPFDIDSIMMQHFERSMFRPPLVVPMNTRLSPSDREFIARLYPPHERSQPVVPADTAGRIGTDPAEDVALQGPIFFLSYPHTRAPASVIDFFRQLSVHVHELLGLSPVEEAGYMDGLIEGGADWSEELMTAVGTCTVFVPLISPRYLRSVWCARELHAFQSRTVHTVPPDKDTSPVLPVLWANTALAELPQMISDLQFFRPTEPEPPQWQQLYWREGVYGLRVARHEGYDTLVWRVAQQIARIHDTHRVEHRIVTDYTTLPSSFSGR